MALAEGDNYGDDDMIFATEITESSDQMTTMKITANSYSGNDDSIN